MSRYRALGLRYGTSNLRNGAGGYDTARSNASCYTAPDTVHGKAGDTAGARCDTAGGGPRYGRLCAATLLGQARATTLFITRAVCAQAGPGCAPGAPDSVLTQCTILSHCSGHCSRALFTRFSKK